MYTLSELKEILLNIVPECTFELVRGTLFVHLNGELDDSISITTDVNGNWHLSSHTNLHSDLFEDSGKYSYGPFIPEENTIVDSFIKLYNMVIKEADEFLNELEEMNIKAIGRKRL